MAWVDAVDLASIIRLVVRDLKGLARSMCGFALSIQGSPGGGSKGISFFAAYSARARVRRFRGSSHERYQASQGKVSGLSSSMAGSRVPASRARLAAWIEARLRKPGGDHAKSGGC